MFSLWNLLVSAVALCSTARHTVTTVSLAGIVERGNRGVGAGRAALVASLHVSSLTLSGSSRSLSGVRYLGRRDSAALYDVGSSEGLDSNATRFLANLKLNQPVSTALPYSGIKALAVYDTRRDLAVFDMVRPRALAVYDRGPQELTVYYRPSALVVYAPPLDYTIVGPSPLPYRLAIHVYSRLFQFDARPFQAYAHWDYQALEHWIAIIASEWPNPQERLTIGEFRRRPEQRIACWLIVVLELGILFTISSMVFVQSRRLHYYQSRVAPMLESEFDMENPKFASKESVGVPTDSSVPTPTMPESIEEELPRLHPCELIGAPTFIEPSTEALQSTAAIPCDHPSPVNLFPETFSMPKPRFGPLDVRSASNDELSRMCRAPRSHERCSSSSGRLHWSFQAIKESYGGAPLAPDITILDSIPQLALSPIFPTLRTSNQHQREQIAPVQVLAVPQTIQTFEATSHRVCRPRRPRR
ncbi:Transmembrane protein [Ceratobasidium theobromae]|uniref:Transmembrane protein n=1 Tax=Ceratobasidium theobromae TaxID=1582974 RepID=A0A5N5QBB2_9AGAM|nr:Transmembrane protein [Ceratobasidium theobromae]